MARRTRRQAKKSESDEVNDKELTKLQNKGATVNNEKINKDKATLGNSRGQNDANNTASCPEVPSAKKIGKSGSPPRKNIKEILSEMISVFPASYKIPKKKASKTDKNDISGATAPVVQPSVRTSEVVSVPNPDVSTSRLEIGERKRKSSTVPDEWGINAKGKGISPGSAGENKAVNVQASEDNSANSSLNSRPKLTARRAGSRAPPDKPESKNEGGILDTPQMALLRARLAERNRSIKPSDKPKANDSNAATPVVKKETPQITLLRAELAERNRSRGPSDKPRHHDGTAATPIGNKGTPQMTLKAKKAGNHETEKKAAHPYKESKKLSEIFNALSPSSSIQSSSSNKAVVEAPIITPTPRVVEAPTSPGNEVMSIRNGNPIPDIFQLVRNNEPSDCNYAVDVTDAMDVDIIQSTPGQYRQLLIVLDTNVWISNRHLIQQILEMNFPLPMGTSSATLVIPWMVLQELDHNIHKGRDKATGFRNAAKFIHSLLSSKHPRVKGQQATEAIIGMEFNELMADDSILNCAIQYSKIPQYRAVLVTNDINLLNKALVHSLTAFKADNELIANLGRVLNEDDGQVISELERSTDTTFSASSPFQLLNSFCSSSGSPSVSHTLNNSNPACVALEDLVMDVDDPMGTEEINDCDDIREDQHLPSVSPTPTFDAVATALQQTLTSIIVPKMVEDFGKDGWRDAIKIPPPFTVESGLKCIQAHWIAVFSYLFASRGKEVVDQLIHFFKQTPGGANAMDVKTWRVNVCQMARVLLLLLNNAVASRPRVVDCCRLLQEFIQFETNSSQ